MPTAPTPITALPTAPSRADPANFAVRADAFLGALATFRAETNALGTNAFNNATEAAASATSATASASAAAAASAAINVTANVSAWVSGTTYSLGAVVYSPTNWQNYRRIVAGAGTTDPSADATNWRAVGFGPAHIGPDPNQVPLNQHLGRMAFLDAVSQPVTPGGGITLATGAICRGTYLNTDGVQRVVIVIDITGLQGGGTAGDIIGSSSTTIDGTRQPAYIGRVPAGMTVLGGRMVCLEAPAGGPTDIDLFVAVEDTGVQDGAVSALTETELINAGVQALGTTTHLAADPPAGGYLYLVSQGTSTTAYTAGRWLIELLGV